MTKEEKNKALHGRAIFFGCGVQGLRHKDRSQLAGWLLLAVAVLLTLIVVPKGGLIPVYRTPGDIASRDIKSPRDLLVEDAPLTEAKRDEAANAVPFVYDLDVAAGAQAIKRIRSGLNLLLQHQQTPIQGEPEEFLRQLEADFGVPLTAEEYRPLLNMPLNQDIASGVGYPRARSSRIIIM